MCVTFLPELVSLGLRREPITPRELLDCCDGHRAILTDDDLIRNALACHGLEMDTSLIAVPDALFCLILRHQDSIRHCSVHTTKEKAERQFVKVIRGIERFGSAADDLSGEHEHDYKLMLDVIDRAPAWSVDFEAIEPID